MKDLAKGFSLLEVLVSTFVIFAAMSVALSVYQNSLVNTRIAASRLDLFENLPQVRALVTKTIQAGHGSPPVDGRLQFADTTYTWTARPLEAALLIDEPSLMSDVSVSQRLNEQRRFYLWEIQVRAVKGKFQQTFVFKEISWDGR